MPDPSSSSHPAVPSGSASEVAAAPPREGSGAQSGVVVLAASMVGHVGNYLFYVIAARLLGAEDFSEVSALIAYALILFLPFNGVQVAAARDVARATATASPAAVAGFLRGLTRWSLLAGLALAVSLLALSPFLTGWLHLSSYSLTLVASLWVVLGVWQVIALGAVQGMQRFGLLAVVLAGPLGALRTAFLPVTVLLAGLAGALWAMVAATIVGLVIMAPSLRRAMSARAPAARFRPGTSMLSLLAFASLTNVDVLVAKATLAAGEAGAYSAAALMGKIALYAPSALAMVLLPKASAALAQGRPIERIATITFAVTVASGLAVAAGFALIPSGLLSATFGPDFAASAHLLAPMAVIMTAAAVLYVHLNLMVARGKTVLVWVVNLAAVGHLGLLAVWHDAPRDIVAATAVAVCGVLVAIEIGSRYGAARTAVRWLGQRRAAAA